MERKQKILLVHNYYQIPGGEDTVVANEKKLLEENGHEVILYTRHNSELKTMPLWHKLLLPLTTIYNPGTARDIKRLIREEKIDVVHVHNTLNLVSPSVYYAARKMGVPVVQTVHNFRLLCPGATFYRDGHICEDCARKSLRCAVKHKCYRGSRVQTLACVISTLIHRWTGIYRDIYYICLTEFNKEKLLQLNRPGKKPLIREDKVFVKPNFTYIESKDTEAGDGDSYLYIGRVEKAKGLDILLDAFSECREYRLNVAGTGAELEYYKQQARERQLDNISFLGFLNREELSEALKWAKAVIVASQLYETFGMIVIEAYAAHRPVIVGDIGNVGDLVESGVTGLKFQYNDGYSLARTIQEFERANRKDWGEEAFQRYQKKYLPEVNYKMLMEIYEGICVKRKK